MNNPQPATPPPLDAFDFDAAFAELDRADKPIIAHNLYGRDWQLPAEPTAAAVLRVARWKEGGYQPGDDLSTQDAALLLADYLPKSTLDAISAAAGAEGFTMSRMAMLAEWLTHQYQQRGGFDQKPDGEEAGDVDPTTPPATAPAEPAGSSSDGPPSKPTSPPATGSSFRSIFAASPGGGS